LQKRGESEATIALKVAVDTCPKEFIEYAGAVAEVKRLER